MSAINDFSRKTVKELQEFLKVRGVTTTNKKKSELITLCEAAKSINIDVDPDGLRDDRPEVLLKKLTTDDGFY